MKKFSILSFLLAVLTLASCTQDELSQESANNDLKDKYIKAWIDKFGLIDSNHTWNMATSVKADVAPAAFGDNTTVRIYSADPRKGGNLVGYATAKHTLNVNVGKDAKTVYVEVKDKNKNVVEAGYYPIENGKVNIAGAPAMRVASRDGDEGDDETSCFQWMIACEDMGTIGDFDFNDIVLGINVVQVDSKSQVSITPMAAGGTLEAKVYIGETEVGEIHKLIAGEDASRTTMLNTTEFTIVPKTKTYEIDGEFNIASPTMGGIKIVVTKADATHEAYTITPPKSGEAPQMFLIQGDWEWPNERMSIKEAYSGFETWSANEEFSTWTSSASGASTIPWKEKLKNAGATTNPDPEDVNPEPEPEPEPIAPNAMRMITSQGQAWSDTWTDKKKTWDYVPGLVSKAMLTYCEMTDTYDNNAFSWAKAYADKAKATDLNDGNGPFYMKTYDGSKTYCAFQKNSLDNIASGKVVLSLYRMANSEKGNISDADKQWYKDAADFIYNYLTGDYTTNCTIESGDAEGCYWHKKDYPNQMWLDGLYMGAAFYAEYLYTFGKTDANEWNTIIKQFTTIHAKTKKSHNGHYLNLHGWSADPNAADSFWANSETGCSQEVWGRAMGWYIAALVDVIEYMQELNLDYSSLLTIYRDVADGILSVQDSGSHVWYQLLEYDSSKEGKSRNNIARETNEKLYDFFNNSSNSEKRDYTDTQSNYLEASASSMFTYGLLKGLRLGLIESSNIATYEDAADKAYKGLLTEFITGEEVENGTIHINNICKSAGLGPAKEPCRDGSVDSYLVGYDVKIVSDEGKGIGSFILASTEYEAYKKAKQQN